MILSFSSVPVPDEDEFALFGHTKDRIFTDFDEIRQEIVAETDRLGGRKVRRDEKFENFFRNVFSF